MNLKNRILKIFSQPEKRARYEFHKWKKQLMIIDKVLYILVIVLLGVFRLDILIIIVYFMLYPYLFLTGRKTAFYQLYVASFLALVWVFIAKDQYHYNINFLTIFGLNSFPLFAWASGLFATYLIYSHWEHKIKYLSFIKKMILFVAIYWPMLFLVEIIFYHVFNIKNLASAVYAGLPICDCIHAPVWMQISYLALGPIYFIICELIGLKNPNFYYGKD